MLCIINAISYIVNCILYSVYCKFCVFVLFRPYTVYCTLHTVCKWYIIMKYKYKYLINLISDVKAQTFWHNFSSLRSANPRWRCSTNVNWLLKNPEASRTVNETNAPSSLWTPTDGKRRIFASNWSRSPGVENFQQLAIVSAWR